MIYLYILKKDGSLYWKENFENKESADKWLQSEMSRLYWNPDYKTTFIDSSDALDSEIQIVNGEVKINSDLKNARIQKQNAEKDALNSLESLKKQRRNAIRSVKNASNVAQIKSAMIELIKYLDIGDQDE